MPWSTPTLLATRQQVRDYVAARLLYPVVANSPESVLGDAMGGLAHLNLQYLDWQARQYLPDTAERQFLDRWGNIYLVNADGSRGRKVAIFASGTVTVTASTSVPLPQGTILNCGTVQYQTTAPVLLGIGANPVPVQALDAGAVGNQLAGAILSLAAGIQGVSGQAPIAVVSMTGGADEESDDELRVRVLDRIRQPPMGGDADDYVSWALDVAGVTRAWCSPLEMGMGTVTVRFMCDDLRATSSPLTNGFPLPADVAAVAAYLDTVRPVAVKDIFVVPPTPQPVNFTITNLVGDSTALRATIAAGVSAMLGVRAAPAAAIGGVGQPAVNIPEAWVDAAIYAAVAGVSYDLTMQDAVMANAGCLAVLGTMS